LDFEDYLSADRKVFLILPHSVNPLWGFLLSMLNSTIQRTYTNIKLIFGTTKYIITFGRLEGFILLSYDIFYKVPFPGKMSHNVAFGKV